MSIKQQITETDGIYFITITCQNWLQLFEISNAYSAVYDWFNNLKINNHYVTGYVIMPDHLHALIGFSNPAKDINRIVGTGKRFMAYNIIDKLKEQKNEIILDQLSQVFSASDRKKGKLHKVFEPSFDIKNALRKSLLFRS